MGQAENKQKCLEGLTKVNIGMLPNLDLRLFAFPQKMICGYGKAGQR